MTFSCQNGDMTNYHFHQRTSSEFWLGCVLIRKFIYKWHRKSTWTSRHYQLNKTSNSSKIIHNFVPNIMFSTLKLLMTIFVSVESYGEAIWPGYMDGHPLLKFNRNGKSGKSGGMFRSNLVEKHRFNREISGRIRLKSFEFFRIRVSQVQPGTFQADPVEKLRLRFFPVSREICGWFRLTCSRFFTLSTLFSYFPF